MVVAEKSTFGILHGRNVRGRNVLAKMSVAKTSVAEISYIPIYLSFVVIKTNLPKQVNYGFMKGETNMSPLFQSWGHKNEQMKAPTSALRSLQ